MHCCCLSSVLLCSNTVWFKVIVSYTGQVTQNMELCVFSNTVRGMYLQVVSALNTSTDQAESLYPCLPAIQAGRFLIL